MTIEQAVREVFARGGLEATAAGRRSLTIEGVALAPIRWQAAICSLLYDAPHGLPPRAAGLAPEISAEIARQRAEAAPTLRGDGRRNTDPA